MVCKTACTQCVQSGMPILFTRYAAAYSSTNEGAAALDRIKSGGRFKTQPGGVSLQKAKYNVRMLRAGYVRGRIRFNRLTRKVYVLRPGYCGGNKVFDWHRLVALCDLSSGTSKNTSKALVLYHPPFDADDRPTRGLATGEDCIFVGSTLPVYEAAIPFWEYIRRYMQDGPTVDKIPPDAPDNYIHVPRYVPADYVTYCGKPSFSQYSLEEARPGFERTLFHMLSQVTCCWPKFPKEWNSDSGVGEPEDRPVQAGATMTALVYRAEGKLSKADEMAFLKIWGTAEALASAGARV